MKEILVVVDMQNDFLTGSLGNKECAATVGPVRELLGSRAWDLVVFTRDTHREDYGRTLEGRKLPVPHCLAGSDGWQIEASLRPFAEAPGALVVDKPTFGSTALADELEKRFAGRDVRFHFCGVCTSICVLSNAALARAKFPDAEIVVHETATADVTPEMKVHALAVLGSIQCDVA